MQLYNILLLGSGGRECALAWKLKQSPLCGNLAVAPGNAGTAAYGTNLPFGVNDFEAIKQYCIDNQVDILFPGGEDSLVKGIYDFFKSDEQLQHIIVAGPSKAGAQLEGSKAFSKKFMQRHRIPTAAYREFDKTSFDEGVAYLQQHTLPVVIKADGLAAGKGVIIAQTHEDAVAAFTSILRDEQFGAAGDKVVIEAFLSGIELSVFAFTDGTNYVLLPEAKDYKRIGEGDTGLNTGGMGAISPVPFADDLFMRKVTDQIIVPTVQGLKAENIVYQGFIFFGLISVGGEPYVIEYNCRMGDPETEVVMPRLENDLVALILSMQEGRLDTVTVQHSNETACTVMLVSQGYPEDYEKGKVIHDLDDVKHSIVFHAGTAQQGEDIVTNGGRVLAITSSGRTLNEALRQSYENAARVWYEGKYYRRDIGWEFLG